MPEVPVSSLDARQQRLLEKARIALEQGDVAYAIQATAQILKEVPGCLPVRRLLRVAQLRKFQAGSVIIGKLIDVLSSTPFLFGSRKTAAESFAVAEKILETNPTSVSGLKLLGESAQLLGLPETAVFAFEAIEELHPDNRENRLALGGAFLAVHKPADALRMVESILRRNPVDADALVLMRRASVALTITKGNWETRASFHEKLKARNKPDVDLV